MDSGPQFLLLDGIFIILRGGHTVKEGGVMAVTIQRRIERVGVQAGIPLAGKYAEGAAHFSLDKKDGKGGEFCASFRGVFIRRSVYPEESHLHEVIKIAIAPLVNNARVSFCNLRDKALVSFPKDTDGVGVTGLYAFDYAFIGYIVH
jgi:hypothetical protein